MYGINTPYYHVQAIRRQLTDQGVPTWARPFYGYHVVVNLPSALPLVGEASVGTETIDRDSYFVWISTSYYTQTDPLDMANIGVPLDGDPFTDTTRIEVSMRLLKSGRALHSPDFIPLAFIDWHHPTTVATGDSSTPNSIFGSEAAAGGGFHGFRAPWPEPILLKPSEMVEIRVRVRFASINRQAHFFSLNGVKLFTGGGA